MRVIKRNQDELESQKDESRALRRANRPEPHVYFAVLAILALVLVLTPVTYVLVEVVKNWPPQFDLNLDHPSSEMIAR
jgi:hypothetical protein